MFDKVMPTFSHKYPFISRIFNNIKKKHPRTHASRSPAPKDAFGVARAGSLGADFGGIFGATLPEGTSAVNVAKTVGLNAVKMGVSWGGFNVFLSEGVLALGGNPATSSGALQGTSSSPRALGATGKSQSSFSLLGNYTLSEYLNVGISSFMQGFTTGTEFAGAFGAATNELAAYAKSSTAAKTALRVIQNKPLVSGAMGTFTFGTTLASGGTFRQAVVGGVASSAFMYGFMGLSEQFNPQLKLGTTGEPRGLLHQQCNMKVAQIETSTPYPRLVLTELALQFKKKHYQLLCAVLSYTEGSLALRCLSWL